MWFAMTFVFEFTLGRFAFGYTWQRILEDYDLSKGGLLLFGVVMDGLFPDGSVRLAMSARPSHQRRTRARSSQR
jgi:hypothetical protein